MQEEVEGPLEGPHAKREVARGHQLPLMASDAPRANLVHRGLRNLARPPRPLVQDLDDPGRPSPRKPAALAMAASGGSMCLSSTSLQSRQSDPRRPAPGRARVAIRRGREDLVQIEHGADIRIARVGPSLACRVGHHRPHLAGGSSARRRRGRSCCCTTSTSSARRCPGTFGISVSFTSGSGNTSRNEWLNRRATSRVSSTWGGLIDADRHPPWLVHQDVRGLQQRISPGAVGGDSRCCCSMRSR